MYLCTQQKESSRRGFEPIAVVRERFNVISTSSSMKLASRLGLALVVLAGVNSSFAASQTEEIHHRMNQAQDPAIWSSSPTVKSVKDGAWSEESTWNNGVPREGDTVLVSHNVHLSSQTEAVLTVQVLGHFELLDGAHLNVDSLLIQKDAELTIGTESAPVSATVTYVDVDGGLDAKLLGQGMIADGKVTVHGVPKTPYADTLGAWAGDTKIMLWEEPQGWNVGDEIAIAATEWGQKKGDERAVVTKISGKVIHLDRALERDHVPPNHTADVTLTVHVANLSRSVVFESTEEARSNRLKRGHTMFTSQDVDVRYAAFNDMGRTDKHLSDNRTFTVDGKVDPQLTNQIGRYSVHFHRAEEFGETPAMIYHNVVNGNIGWAYVNHGSYVDMSYNIAYDVAGAALVAERGDEIGRFHRNLVMRVQNRKKPRGSAGSGFGFWNQGSQVAFTENIISGANIAMFYRFSPIDGAKLTERKVNMATGNTIYVADVGISSWKASKGELSHFLTWRTANPIRMGYTSRTTHSNHILIGDPEVPFGTGFIVNFGNSISDSHIEGFQKGVTQGARLTKGGVEYVRNTHLNNVVDVALGITSRETRPDNNPHYEISGVTFGTLPEGQEQYSASIRANFKTTDMNFKSNFRPKYSVFYLEGWPYRMMMKEEQSMDYVPITAERWSSKSKVHRSLVGLTNREMLAWSEANREDLYIKLMGSTTALGHVIRNYPGSQTVVGGYLLPDNWQNNPDYIDATTDEFERTYGIRKMKNIVLWKVTAENAPKLSTVVLPGEGGSVTPPEEEPEEPPVVVEKPIAKMDKAQTRGKPVRINVLRNDTDAAGKDTLSIVSVTQPPHGEAIINDDDTVTFIPDLPKKVGRGSFSYTITNEQGGLATARVRVNVRK
jgi:hypothetical protein